MQTLTAYQVAIELVRELRTIVVELQKQDANLADQIRRAATSVVSNLSEGQRRTRGSKHHAFEIAHGEAREVLGCLECAEAWGYRALQQATVELVPDPIPVARPLPTWVIPFFLRSSRQR